MALHLAVRLFPGIRAGASLKRGQRAGRNAMVADLFPGIRAGASLKCTLAAHLDAHVSSLPRHSCRGLIEALLPKRKSPSRNALFLGIRAGASLKRRDQRFHHRLQHSSSPAFVPGPH